MGLTLFIDASISITIISFELLQINEYPNTGNSCEFTIFAELFELDSDENNKKTKYLDLRS